MAYTIINTKMNITSPEIINYGDVFLDENIMPALLFESWGEIPFTHPSETFQHVLKLIFNTVHKKGKCLCRFANSEKTIISMHIKFLAI